LGFAIKMFRNNLNMFAQIFVGIGGTIPTKIFGSIGVTAC
jgi:hypothetical protein